MTDLEKWHLPPFHYVAMPLNAEGNGPETDEAKVTHTEHQVWNAACEVVAVCPSEQVAKFVVAGLRRVRPPSASDDDELDAAGGDHAIADLLVRWQTDRSEWFENTTLGIVAEYAAWRERALLTDDDWFRRQYPAAQAKGDWHSIACLLSGRLRQMEKRAVAANKRADGLEKLHA